MDCMILRGNLALLKVLLNMDSIILRGNLALLKVPLHMKSKILHGNHAPLKATLHMDSMILRGNFVLHAIKIWLPQLSRQVGLEIQRKTLKKN